MGKYGLTRWESCFYSPLCRRSQNNYSVCALCIKYLDEADVAKVVRCKDCANFTWMEDGTASYCKHRLGLKYFVEADDFCCHGERKENAGQIE